MTLVLSKYDVIVIGAGLGGLTAAAKLAKEGYSVLVIEQHSIVGGCSTKFSNKHEGKEITFEVGLHEMGLSEGRRKMFSELGMDDLVEFIRVPEFYRLIKGDLDVIVHDDLEKTREGLIEKFPEEKKAIETYLQDVVDIRAGSYAMRWRTRDKIFKLPKFWNAVKKLLKYRRYTLSQYLDELTDNEDLKFTIIGNLGYYHDDPNTLSFLFFAMGQASYLQNGGYFVKGGSQALSDAFAKVIEDNGGHILLKHKVTEILVEQQKVKGVKYVRRNSDEVKVVNAPVIIANTAMPNVVNDLIPALEGSNLQKKINAMETPNSLLTVYYAFKKPVTDLFEGRYSTFMFNENMKTLDDFGPNEKTHDYSKKGIVFVDYSSVDSGLNEDIPTGVVCAIDYIENWDKDADRQAYKKKKQEVIDTINDRLEEKFPGFKDRILYTTASTPHTIQRYTLNPRGNVYGFAQTPEQALSMKPKMFEGKVRHLLFASAWVVAGGFGGSISAGYLAATQAIYKIKVSRVKC